MRFLIFLAMFVPFLNCNNAVIKSTVMPEKKIGKNFIDTDKTIGRPVYYSENDTATYVISFSNEEDYIVFRKRFDSLFSDYAFDTLSVDTVKNHFCLILTGKQIVTNDSLKEKDSLIDISEREIDFPERFGRIKIYTGGGFHDEILELLTETSLDYKMEQVTIDTMYTSVSYKDTLTINKLDLRKINDRFYSLIIDTSILDMNGKQISSFDLAESWNKMLQYAPATAHVFFKNVKGANSVIEGREAVTQGFKIRDKFNIDFQLSVADTLFDKTFFSSSAKLFSFIPGYGAYGISELEEDVITLRFNENSKGEEGFAEEYLLFDKLDNKSMISFSRGDYDVVPFYSKKDLAYAEKLADKGSTIDTLENLILYVSLNFNKLNERRELLKKLNPSQILNNALKGVGEYFSFEKVNDSLVNSFNSENILSGKDIKILFRENCSIERITAEKIYANLTGSGLSAELLPADETIYEKSLILKDYQIAVGTMGEEKFKNEKDFNFLSLKYFGISRSYDEHLRNLTLISILSLKRWTLCRGDVKNFTGRLNGFYKLKGVSEERSISEDE